MKKITYNLLIISIITFLGACTAESFQTVVTYNVPVEKKRMVINSEITAGNDTMVVFLSRSRTTSEAITPAVDTLSKASLSLLKDGAAFKNFMFLQKETALDKDNQDQYLYKYIALVDKNVPLAKYTLKGSALGYDDISSDDVLAPPVVIKNIRFEANGFESLTTNFGGKPTKTIQDLIEFTIDDPSGKNYYLLEVRATQPNNQGVVSQRTINFNMNQQFEASSGSFSGRKAVISDQTFDGKSFKFQMGVNSRGGKGGGPGGGGGQTTVSEFQVILRSVSRNSYLFEQSLAAYNANNGNPFAEPVVLYTNISKGYGLFSMQQKSTAIVKP
jgi:Domain of unknown function (DUF4249)